MSDIKKWLMQGWNDLKKNPIASLGYGVIFALVGIILSVIGWTNPVFVAATTTGFLLVGPFLALGLYDLSRRIEHREPPTFFHSLSAIKHNIFGLGIYAIALGIIMTIWVRTSALVVGVLFNNPPVAEVGYIGLFKSLLTVEQGWMFLIGFFGTGLLFALAAFITGVVTVPMLMHRKVDIVTAVSTSVKAVFKSPAVMAVWAISIAVIIGLGIASFYIGLIITMPLIAHASWHAYRDLVENR